MKFTFGGYEFDTELEYLTTDLEIVKVETYDDKLMKVTKVECGSWYTTNKNIFIDISKLSAPERVKIVPENGKVYKLQLKSGDTSYFQWYDGYTLADDEEIICEMVERV